MMRLVMFAIQKGGDIARMDYETLIRRVCDSDETLFMDVNRYVQAFERKTKRKNAKLTLAVTDAVIDMVNPFDGTHDAVLVMFPKTMKDTLTEVQSTPS